MHWIVQSNIFSEAGFNAIVDALQRLGLTFSVHRCIPFVGTLDPEPSPTQDRVIVLGTLTLAEEARRRGWVPGVLLNDNFDFRVQRQHWGEHLLNAGATVCSFDAVPEQPAPFFIRPVDDGKQFVGQVMVWRDFAKWRDEVLALTEQDHAPLRRDTMVLVGPPRTIFAEYRTWVVDGRAVAWSQYKFGDTKRYRAEVDRRVLDFAEERARDWSPHRAFVLDIFDTPDGLKIGEVNCLNAAGFYAANVGRLIEALETAFG